MARLVLLRSATPESLLRHAAASLAGRGAGSRAPLPLVAVRQGGLRDDIQTLAAAQGCSGWLGAPLVTFAELPALLAGDLAPLSAFERHAILRRLLAGAKLSALGETRRHRGFVQSLDALFGELVAERVEPGEIERHLKSARRDAWESARDADIATLYAAYRDALSALPPVDGVRRTDGRDGYTLAAEAMAASPDQTRRRLRHPFADPDAPRTVALLGLSDLRRGWDRLLDALRAADFVDELRVYLSLPDDASDGATTSDHDLWSALLARKPDDVVRLDAEARPAERRGPSAERRPSALAHLVANLFSTDTTAPRPAPARAEVDAIAAPDLARELEIVARRVKRLLVEEGVAPNRIAIVPRKSRPYGNRAVEVLRRHGIPVTARLRTTLAEVPAVAALLRVFRAAHSGWRWRTLAGLAESPYFDLALDVGVLRRIGSRSPVSSLDGWYAELDRMLSDARVAAEHRDDEHRGPDPERAQAALDAFLDFRETAERLDGARSAVEWIALTLSFLGAAPDGGRPDAGREGLWNLCANACRLPGGEHDPLAVDAARTDAEAIRTLVSLLLEWRAALALEPDDAPLSPGAWHAALREQLEDTELALWTPHRRGVQVLESLSALGRTFDHIFLVGMSAGAYPSEAPPRELFSDAECEALHAAGLPVEPARVFFAREAALFSALVRGARTSLTVSHAYADAAGGVQLPSAYFDEVVSRFASPDTQDAASAWPTTIPGSRLVPDALDDVWCVADLHLFAAGKARGDATRDEAARVLRHLAALPEQERLVRRVLDVAGAEHLRLTTRAAASDRASAAHAFNGGLGADEMRALLAASLCDDRVWSASELEAYGRCPWSFFARHVLGLRRFEEPEEDGDVDGATRGAMLHRCLEMLHLELANAFGEKALTSEARRHAERSIPAIVRRVLDEFALRGRTGHPRLLAFRERELGAAVAGYLDWEIAENERTQRQATPRRRPVACEVTFGMNGSPPVTLQRGGSALKLRGKIDRVDELLDPAVAGWRYIVDHKTSDGSLKPVSLYDHGGILQLPLYILALEAMQKRAGGASVWGGAYQVADGEGGSRTAALHPYSLSKGKIREGETKTEQDSASRIHDALDLALSHVRGAREGRFPAMLPSCLKECPKYCEVRDICREDRVKR